MPTKQAQPETNKRAPIEPSDAALLDKQIAELYGWRDLEWAGEWPGRPFRSAAARTRYSRGWFGTAPDGTPDSFMPRKWASDATTALALLDVAADNGTVGTVKRMPEFAEQPCKWLTTFDRNDVVGYRYGLAVGESMPDVICRAFVAWIERSRHSGWAVKLAWPAGAPQG